MTKQLLKGNEAIAEAALRAGLEAYFGYPITPQTEVLEHLARRMPELGRVFLQAESETASINMVYGAACTGARVMTSSSSPGVSLMLENIGFAVGTETPCVIVNVMRGGPTTGIPTVELQGDVIQVRRGSHGDYQIIALARVHRASNTHAAIAVLVPFLTIIGLVITTLVFIAVFFGLAIASVFR